MIDKYYIQALEAYISRKINIQLFNKLSSKLKQISVLDKLGAIYNLFIYVSVYFILVTKKNHIVKYTLH